MLSQQCICAKSRRSSLRHRARHSPSRLFLPSGFDATFRPRVITSLDFLLAMAGLAQ